MTEARFVPLEGYREYPKEEMERRAREFYAQMDRRRTVRQFLDRPVPRQVIEYCLKTAGTAPSVAPTTVSAINAAILSAP